MIIGQQKSHNLSNLLNSPILAKTSLRQSEIIPNRNHTQNISSNLDNELNIILAGSKAYNKGFINSNNHNSVQMTQRKISITGNDDYRSLQLIEPIQQIKEEYRLDKDRLLGRKYKPILSENANKKYINNSFDNSRSVSTKKIVGS